MRTPNSGERKQPSSSLCGVLTRSRSQLLLHQNRSGPRLKEPSPEDMVPVKDLCKKRKTRDGELSRPVAKDLRSRRVYSTRSGAGAGVSSDSIEDAFPKGTDVGVNRKIADLGFGSYSDCEKEGLESEKLGKGFSSVDQSVNSVLRLVLDEYRPDKDSDMYVDDVMMDIRSEATESSDVGISCKAWSFDRGNAESSDESGKLEDHKQCDGEDGGNCSEKIDDLDEERVLTTPPDAEICGNSMVNGDEGKREEEMRGKDAPFTGNAEENAGEGFLRKDSQSNDSVVKNKSVLRPRFQGKLFKAPGSVSYRRLFPYLMDIKEDVSGTPKLVHCQKDVKVIVGQESQLPLSSQNQEASKRGLKTESCTMLDNNRSKLTSPNSLESPMELDAKEVTSECLSVPSVDEKCLSESKADPTADSHCVKDIGHALHNDDLKQYSSHKNNVGDAKATEPHLRRKLFKTPGSVSYRRLLPFIMDLTKDDSGTSKFGHQTHHQRDEADMYTKRFQLPLSSQSQEASFDEHKTDSGPLHGTVESNALVNNILVNPVNELSHFDQPKSTSSQDLPELPMQLDAEEVVHECSSAPSVNEHIEKVVIGSKDECLSESKSDLCPVTTNFHCAKNAANVARNDGFKQNETSSHASSRNDDVVVLILNHVSVSNEESRPPPEKIILEKSDMAGHGDGKAGSVLKGKVHSSRMTSKGSNNKNASCIGEVENVSESKATLVLNRGPRIKLLKHAGSFNYKRLLPFILNNRKDNSGASVKDHYPKLQKCLDQTPLPISASNVQVTPASDLNGCVPMGHCTGNSGTQQQIVLNACDSNNDSSSLRSRIPEFQSSLDSCKVIRLQDEQVVLNGFWKLESSTNLPISVHRVDLPITPLATISNEVVSREEKAKSALSESSVYSELKGNSSSPISSNEEKPPETHGFCQSLSQLKVLEQLRIPAVGFRKGILKKNPRGCRGLCTCLNCASFRLHAERAFEFSRNQFLDAEEVAEDLIKELSHLRNMLEISIDSVNDNPAIDGSKVKEACRKAFAAEQLAKDRLSEMNDNLNIHCRTLSLQRPRVRFADNVEEKVFQPDR